MAWFQNLSEKTAGLSSAVAASVSKSVEAIKGTVIGEQTYIFDGAKYILDRKLADGGFASVYHARDEQGNEYAVKKLIVEKRDLEKIKTEVAVMKILQHKNVVKFKTAKVLQQGSSTNLEVFVIMEFCPGGNLSDLIWKRKEHGQPLAADEILALFVQICDAVNLMHSQSPPVAHRDLKAENVLLDRQNVPKLCDFGSATRLTYRPQNERERVSCEEEIQLNTTLLFRAPEMLDLYRQQTINEKVDIWALGCLLYNMCFGQHPFDQRLGILNVNYPIPEFHAIPQSIIKLIGTLLNGDPTARPNIKDVLSMVNGLMSKSTESVAKSPSKSVMDNLAAFEAKKHRDSDPSVSVRSSQGHANGESVVSNTPAPASTGTTAKPNSLFATLDWIDSSKAPVHVDTTVTHELQQQQLTGYDDDAAVETGAPLAEASQPQSPPQAAQVQAAPTAVVRDDWLAFPAPTSSSNAVLVSAAAPSVSEKPAAAAPAEDWLSTVPAAAAAPAVAAPVQPTLVDSTTTVVVSPSVAQNKSSDFESLFFSPPSTTTGSPVVPPVSAAAASTKSASAVDLFDILNVPAKPAAKAHGSTGNLLGQSDDHDPMSVFVVPTPTPTVSTPPTAAVAAPVAVATATPPLRSANSLSNLSASAMAEFRPPPATLGAMNAKGAAAPAPAQAAAVRTVSPAAQRKPLPFDLLPKESTPQSLTPEQINLILSELTFLRKRVAQLEARP